MLTLDKAIANLQAMTGADLATAVRLASINPARMTCFQDIGEVRVGSMADLTCFDRNGTLLQTYVRGVPVPVSA